MVNSTKGIHSLAPYTRDTYGGQGPGIGDYLRLSGGHDRSQVTTGRRSVPPMAFTPSSYFIRTKHSQPSHARRIEYQIELLLPLNGSCLAQIRSCYTRSQCR